MNCNQPEQNTQKHQREKTAENPPTNSKTPATIMEINNATGYAEQCKETKEETSLAFICISKKLSTFFIIRGMQIVNN